MEDTNAHKYRIVIQSFVLVETHGRASLQVQIKTKMQSQIKKLRHFLNSFFLPRKSDPAAPLPPEPPEGGTAARSPDSLGLFQI